MWHQWQLTLTLISNLELFCIPQGKLNAFEKWTNAVDQWTPFIVVQNGDITEETEHSVGVLREVGCWGKFKLVFQGQFTVYQILHDVRCGHYSQKGYLGHSKDFPQWWLVWPQFNPLILSSVAPAWFIDQLYNKSAFDMFILKKSGKLQATRD